MSKSILVTGAAGFIGSHLVEALLARGDTVVGLDNFDPFYDPEIKRRNVEPARDHAGYLLVEGDLRDDTAMRRVFAHGPFDTVVHLAARAGVRPSIREPLLYDDVNVTGTTRLLEYARRHGSGNLVLASSSSVYGATSQVPFVESDPADRPVSPYASTKRANELTAHAHHHLHGLDIACLRFFTVYGPRQRPEMAIHKFTRAIDAGETVEIYGDGRSQRDYTYIDDIVDGVLRSIDRPSGYRIYNLGGTATTALIDLAGMIADRLGREADLRFVPDQPGDVPITYADVSLAREELGYAPRTTIDRGLDLFVAWFVGERRQRPALGVTA